MAHIRDEMRVWVGSATQLIRFKPDREAVAKELMEHIDDKTLDIQRIFPSMTEREAMQRALDGMGDPNEIGRELAKIHKPWWGYIWRMSQVLVWSALVFALLGTLSSGLTDIIYRFYYAAEEWAEYTQDVGNLFGDHIPEGDKRLARYVPNAATRFGECTISVPRAVRYQPAGGEERLYLEMCLDYDTPWLRNDRAFAYTWAEDDLGNRYNEKGCRFEAKKISGLTKAYCCMILDVPKEAKWIEFHCEYRPGLDLRVDLTREVRG